MEYFLYYIYNLAYKNLITTIRNSPNKQLRSNVCSSLSTSLRNLHVCVKSSVNQMAALLIPLRHSSPSLLHKTPKKSLLPFKKLRKLLPLLRCLRQLWQESSSGQSWDRPWRHPRLGPRLTRSTRPS